VPEKLPNHPIPVALIGRLAVDNGASGRGVGETLLIHALRSAQQASEIVRLYAVVVDALNQQAKNFYLKYGFNEISDDHLHLYLPMKTIKQLKL
jgi:ribosomal protein S18 acetylase RimI-like enzyme